MAVALTRRQRRALWVLVIAIIGVRLLTLAAYPLMDPTEARYGEIARKMLETGNWVMPQFDYGVPFWGKPPLSTWLSAGAMVVLGSNEFAARLPSLLLLVGCGALVYALAAQRAGRDAALWAIAIFATTGLVFVAAGAVMTDPALTLGTTLSMAGFWLAVDGESQWRRLAALAFFLGLAVGLLAKGPIAVVLTLAPIGAWTLSTRQWRTVWTRLPWITGSMLTAALVVPWYLAAESTTPGFLEYFFIGEHWKRFTQPGWTGDLYGAAHARPRGIIWILWLGVALPWSAVALAWLARAAITRRSDLRALAADSWSAYFLLWAVTPMAFFTVSGNVLPTYVLPGLPALALLVGDRWRPSTTAAATALGTPVRTALVTGAVLCIGLFAATIFLHQRAETELSHKALLRVYTAARIDGTGRLLYLMQQPVSAQFYSGGKAIKLADVAALAPYLDDAPRDFLAVRERDLARLPAPMQARLAPLGAFGEYRLFRELPRTGADGTAVPMR
ncbi:MAG: glycosyltransferase family 39 protein [Casimicrobiaceae bacterium]